MVLRKDAKVDLVKRIPLFAGCSRKDLREIARVSEEVDFDAGTVFIHEGEPGHEVYVVVSGELEVSRHPEGALATIQAGQVVGEMALLSDKPRNATVTASTPVHLLAISDTNFLGLLDQMPLLWLKIARALADRVADDERLDLYYRD